MRAQIGYLEDLPDYDHEVPYYLYGVSATSDVPETNISIIATYVDVKDIRDQDHLPVLAKDAYQLLTWPNEQIQYGSDPNTTEQYCRQMMKRVQELVGAEHAYVFDYRFRSSDVKEKDLALTTPFGADAYRYHKPVPKVHIDQTQEGGLRRLKLHLTAEEYKKYISPEYRVRIINIWRSLKDAPQDMPLAFCKPESIAKEDPTLVEIVESGRLAQNYYLKYNSHHDWVWASDMKPTEVMVFATWDSAPSEGATNCAYHSAFVNDDPSAQIRQSIEVRTIMINKIDCE